MDSVEVGRRLQDDLHYAQVEYQSSSHRFTALVRTIPSGIPHPDGMLNIQQASRASQRALEVYAAALKRYSDFILHRVVPEDLKQG